MSSRKQSRFILNPRITRETPTKYAPPEDSMNTKKNLKLFTPVQLGSLKLKHRVVMAPLTRSRAEQPGGIPGDMMVQYYSDRASDGGLIISEATNISPTARGWYGAPGIYTAPHTEGWDKLVNPVPPKPDSIF